MASVNHMGTTALSKRLWAEIIAYPLILSIGTITISAFMSYVLFGDLEWRGITLGVTAEELAMCWDHYKDHTGDLIVAQKKGDHSILAIFRYAQWLLMANASLFVAALVMSPPTTWMLATIFFGPAFLWSSKIRIGSSKGFVIKRIPGMKNVMAALIKGYGICSVIRSVSPNSLPMLEESTGPWTPLQMMVWPTLAGFCHSTLLDIRDFDDDRKDGIRTIPVLLGSVSRAKFFLTLIHIINIIAFPSNHFTTAGTICSIALLWALNNNSQRKFFFFSTHMRTIVILAYLATRVPERLLVTHVQLQNVVCEYSGDEHYCKCRVVVNLLPVLSASPVLIHLIYLI